MRRIASSIDGRGTVTSATRAIIARASIACPAAAQSCSNAG